MESWIKSQGMKREGQSDQHVKRESSFSAKRRKEADLSNVAPASSSILPSDEETFLGIEEDGVVRGRGDVDRVVEEGEAELSEPFGESKEVGCSVEVVGIRGGSELEASEQGVLEDSLDDLNRKPCG